MRVTRRARGAVRRLLHAPVKIWYHPAFRLPLAGFEAVVGMDPRRADHVLTWLLDADIVREQDVLEPEEAPFSWLLQVHTEDYLASLDQPETLSTIIGMDAARIPAGELLGSWRRGVGGTVAAARHVVREGGRAAVLLGGYHHAAPARGAGFCGLNDVAVAIAQLREQGFHAPIAVLDVDAHPPDGLAECVAHDPGVTIVSVGVESEWAIPAGVRDHRLPRGSTDAAYLRALELALAELPDAGLVFAILGADPLAGDRFGGLACTERGLRRRDRAILDRIGPTPLVMLPAGGYTHGAWRVFAGAVAEAAGSRHPVPEGYDPTLRRGRRIFRSLDPKALGEEDAWITADDLAEVLGMGAPAEPRLLGYYTRHGIEYALSRYGLLETLRRMGFRDLQVEMDARDLPHRVRVTADLRGRREILVELSVSIRPVGHWRTLFIEWLTLRDPRVPFTAARPRLPGQDAPGLGLAEDVGQLMLRMAERLGLAGVSFVPAHFHVARMARHQFVFVDPAVRGRVLAMARHLAHLPLVEASALLDGRGIPTEDGEPVRWSPELMVFPRDPELADWLQETDERALSIAEATRDRMLPLTL